MQLLYFSGKAPRPETIQHTEVEAPRPEYCYTVHAKSSICGSELVEMMQHRPFVFRI
jgi:hypothetical protein